MQFLNGRAIISIKNYVAISKEKKNRETYKCQ